MEAVILQYLLGPVVTAFMGYVIWKLQQQTKQTSANNRGTMILLRDKIFEDHEKYVIQGKPMPSYAYDNFLETYTAYRELGGNGVTHKMKEEIEHLHLASIKRD